MTQAERDRLVALKKAKKKLITQKQAAEEVGSRSGTCGGSCANCGGKGRSSRQGCESGGVEVPVSSIA